MRLLLDRHIWLWSLSNFDRLSRRVATALEDGKNELWLSPISVWELVILCKKGRVALEDGVDAWVAKAMKRIPLNEAPITHEVALETHRIPLTHHDPADRFLAATAKVFDLTLVTADERLLAVKGIPVLANR